MVPLLLFFSAFSQVNGGLMGRPKHYELHDYVLGEYNKRLIPKTSSNQSIRVRFSIELYQIIEVNELQQFMELNAWIAERWMDRLLGWRPDNFDNITELMVPTDVLWIPDTTLYNSLVMEDADTRRLQNAKITTNGQFGNVEVLYPTIYRFSCMLNLRFFPFDVQSCKLTFGSWAFDNTNIDYEIYDPKQGIGTKHCLDNEGWTILGTKATRQELKFACCPHNYTLLDFYLIIRRKPLYWIVNLIAPTSVITLIAIIGFFSSSSINDLREEKISLGITTLLSMSILIFMVADQMPSTSSFIPLIGWFYTCMILLISVGTLFSSFIISIQKKGILGRPPSARTVRLARRIGALVGMQLPLLMKQALAAKAAEDRLKRAASLRKESVWRRLLTGKVNIGGTSTPKKNSSSAGISPLADSRSLLNPILPTTCELNANEESIALMSEDKAAAAPMLPPRQNFADMKRTASFEPQAFKLNGDMVYSMDGGGEQMAMPPVSRNLAEFEYDWLAAVIERCCLIVFFILWCLMSVGINAVGMYYWYTATLDSYKTGP